MKKEIKNYIETWERRCYSNGIPDEIPLGLNNTKKVPNYKNICLSILNNDLSLKSIGLNKKKSRYYHILKKMELKNKGKLKQMELF